MSDKQLSHHVERGERGAEGLNELLRDHHSVRKTMVLDSGRDLCKLDE